MYTNNDLNDSLEYQDRVEQGDSITPNAASAPSSDEQLEAVVPADSVTPFEPPSAPSLADQPDAITGTFIQHTPLQRVRTDSSEEGDYEGNYRQGVFIESNDFVSNEEYDPAFGRRVKSEIFVPFSAMGNAGQDELEVQLPDESFGKSVPAPAADASNIFDGIRGYTEVDLNPAKVCYSFFAEPGELARMAPYARDIIRAIKGYLNSRGFQFTALSNATDADVIQQHLSSLVSQLDKNRNSYLSSKAQVLFGEDRRATYEKCDLAFSALVALEQSFTKMTSTSDLSALIKKYLELDAEIEADKLDRRVSKWQSSQPETSYNSKTTREEYQKQLNGYTENFEFKPYEHSNRSSSSNFSKMFKVLCQHEPFVEKADAILTELSQRHIKIQKGMTPGFFKRLDPYDNYRVQFVEATLELLSQHEHQNPQHFTTVLTRLLWLECKCNKDAPEDFLIEEGVFFSRNNGKYPIIVKGITDDKASIKLTEWLGHDVKEERELPPTPKTSLKVFAETYLEQIKEFEQQFQQQPSEQLRYW